MTGPRLAFVTGATGVVGTAVVASLLDDGWTVRALVRRSGAVLPARAEQVVGDLDHVPALQEGLDGADAVVHLAAQLHINDPSPELAGLYRHVNTRGTERLATLAAKAGVERFAFASTINVYGVSTAEHVWTEDDEPQPQTLYARTKRDAEDAVRSLPGGVVLRLAAVYGPGMKGNYPLLAKLLRTGVRVLPGDGANRRTLVHVEDVAQAFRLAAGGQIPAGTYNVTDGHVHSFDEIVRSLQQAVGVRPGVRYVPAAPVRAALRLPSALARLVGRSFPGPALVDKLTEDVAVSGQQLIEATPYRPAFERLADGWAASGLGRHLAKAE